MILCLAMGIFLSSELSRRRLVELDRMEYHVYHLLEAALPRVPALLGYTFDSVHLVGGNILFTTWLIS